MMLRRVLAVFTLAIWSGTSVLAENVALVIANEDYAALDDARGAAAVSGTADILHDMGFQVIEGVGLDALAMRNLLADLHQEVAGGGAERVVIVLAGHFAQSRSGAWFIGSNSPATSLALADEYGLRLDTVLEVASAASNAAVVWLAEPAEAQDFGTGLSSGLPTRLMVPQGVGVVRGSADHIISGLRASLQPGTALAAVVDRDRNLSGEGTIPALIPFLPAGFAPVARADLRAFADAQEADTEAAYLAYLEVFPNGQNAQAARAALERIRSAPERVEERLFLTRDERRAIQRDLTLLGFDTRGIDGIFGPGTRGSIAIWQGQNDLDETGFLTREQIFRLAAQGAEQAARRDAAERERRAAEERDDREFWAATGAAGDEPGLRNYLERYPEGIFSTLARDRLAILEENARVAIRERDALAWQNARARDSVAGYQAYLQDWPDGAFAAQAEERLSAALGTSDADAALEGVTEVDANAAARVTEDALGLSIVTRQLIEQRLSALGFNPGPVDGRFDAQTRAAIGQAQAEFGLPQSGFMTQDLIGMLISSALRDIFD